MAFNQIFVAPALQKLRIRHPRDPTWGRWLLPECAFENQLEQNERSALGLRVAISDDEKGGFPASEVAMDVTVRRRRVFLDRDGKAEEGEDVELTRDELTRARGRKWVYYKVWEIPQARTNGKGQGCDIVICHGMGEYGGKFSATARSLLEEGFRVVAPDMPAHGRSTGVHVHLKTTDMLPNAVLAVLTDLGRWSAEPSTKTFLYGTSMGGFTAVNYFLKHDDKIPIDGIFLVCPLLGISPESKKPEVVKYIAQFLSTFIGRLPLLPSIINNITRDDVVIEEWRNDDRVYHGNLRVATGLTLVTHLDALAARAPTFTAPIHIVHGDADRVTSHLHSQAFVENCGSLIKKCEIYEGCEHVIFRVNGEDERNERIRRRFLRDRDGWFIARATSGKEDE